MSGQADPLSQPEHLSLPGLRAERDALLAENQRLQQERDDERTFHEAAWRMAQKAEAENQRYEKVLERIEATPTKANDPLVLHKLEQIKDIARAALAGEDG